MVRAIVTLVLFALLALAFPVSHGKVWQGSVRLSPRRPFSYITSFTYDTGKGKVEVSIDDEYIKNAPSGTKVLAVLDEDWSTFLSEDDCEARERLNRWEVTLEPGKTIFKTSISQSIRPHVWYLVLSFCNRPGSGVAKMFKKARVKLTATFLQDSSYGNRDQFSYEDMLPARLIPLLLFVFTVAAAFIGKLFMQRRKESDGAHPTLWMVMSALSMHWVFLAVHTLHLRAYAENGEGLRLLDVVGEILHIGGQLLVSYVLVGLAYGWTLSSEAVQKYIPDDKSIVYLTAGCLGFVHLMFVILGRMTDDHHSKMHFLDSFPAYFLIAIRLFLLVVFLVGALKTLGAEHSPRRRGFLARLVVLGTLWFAVVPGLVVIAPFCAEYMREPVVTVGVLLAQSLGLSVLSWLFLTRNEYYKMSSIATAGMLPMQSFGVDKRS